MTRKRTSYRVLRRMCKLCPRSFIEKITHAGKPPQYCRECRKDYLIYPGSARRVRRLINQGGLDRRVAWRMFRKELTDKRIGKFSEEQDD